MRRLLALLMLAFVALSGAAPTCAQPVAHHGMTHRAPMPGHCDRDAVAHECFGCGVALPDPPRIEAAGPGPIAPPPIADTAIRLVGTQPQQPLPPPRFLA